jgi:hypothetical protein
MAIPPEPIDNTGVTELAGTIPVSQNGATPITIGKNSLPPVDSTVNPSKSTSYLEDSAFMAPGYGGMGVYTGNRTSKQDTVSPDVISQEPDKTTIAGSGSAGNTGGGKSADVPKEKPNPLHAYVNYTYNISLYAVPKDVMNQVTDGKLAPGGEDGIISQSQLILRSGGSKSADKGSLFGVDFYIDNIKFKSIVGISARNRSTDVIEMSFDVIEPYTVTFLPRLIAQAMEMHGRPDWAMNFYLMKIQFLGYDDSGNVATVPKATKFIPMNFTNMEYSITEKGSVYSIKAVPCHHFAMTPLDNTIPFHMEIVGGTVDEIFNGPAGTTADGSPSTTSQGGSNTVVKGVKIALNDGETYLQKKKQITYPTKYNFRFEDGLGDAKVVDPAEWSRQGFRMSDPKNPNELVGKTIKLDPSKQAFRVQSGARITDLIGSVLQISTYMSEQYKPGGDKGKPLSTYKITPEVKFGEYDPLTNMWAREVTYVVMPYIIHGSDADGFGQKAPPGASKRYKWIFTGQNKDVIDVRFDIKTALFTLRNGAEAALLEADKKEDPEAGGSTTPTPEQVGIVPKRTKVVWGLADANNTGPRTLNKKTLAVEELFKQQFDQVAENIQLDLTIVGDPDLIQQDSIFYGVSNNKNQLIYDHGSLNFDHYEAYFYFEFRTPMNDYDDDTGLFQLQSVTTEMFNGLYKIIAVSSEFRGGKFIQKLDNFRVKYQSNPAPSSSDTAATPVKKAESPTITANVSNPETNNRTNEEITDVFTNKQTDNGKVITEEDMKNFGRYSLPPTTTVIEDKPNNDIDPG